MWETFCFTFVWEFFYGVKKVLLNAIFRIFCLRREFELWGKTLNLWPWPAGQSLFVPKAFKASITAPRRFLKCLKWEYCVWIRFLSFRRLLCRWFGQLLNPNSTIFAWQATSKPTEPNILKNFTTKALKMRKKQRQPRQILTSTIFYKIYCKKLPYTFTGNLITLIIIKFNK